MSVPDAPSTARDRLGLTTRGWLFLSCGVAVAIAGFLRGVVPAVQLGTLVAALPLIAAAVTRGPRRPWDFRRVLSARELPSGGELHVTVEVAGRFARSSSVLLEDLAAPELGGSRRRALTGLAGRAVTRTTYTIVVGARGMHELGPLRMHVMDRFGMVHRVRSVGLRDHVLVVPRTVPLDALVLGGASLGSGAGHLGALGAATDDVIPRDYRPGDEVRRIDWKASARSGALMVRSEENPWRSSVTILVDLRRSAHAGVPPDSTVDLALTAAASVGCMALEHGWDIDVRTTDDVLIFAGSPLTGVAQERRELLHALATVPTSGSEVPSPTLRHTADVTSRGPVVLVTSDLSAGSPRLLASIGAHSRQRLLLGVDARGWRGEGAREAAGDPAAALGGFAAAGWRATLVGRGADLRSAWAGLAA